MACAPPAWSICAKPLSPSLTRTIELEPGASDSLTQKRLETYHEQGFVILAGLLSPTHLEATRSALAPYLETGPRGRNGFEGDATQRVYSLVGRGAIFEQAVLNPDVLSLMDQLLLDNYLLTASQAICIGPGETPQPVHYDDTFFTIPRPRPAISVSTIWALDDFTAENGGTELIPGSHLWDDAQVEAFFSAAPDSSRDRRQMRDLVALEMAAGSCVVFAGTLLHRGGANSSTGLRRAMSHQYCEPWARQQENYTLSIPHDRAAKMPARLQTLLGYSIHPPFMGQIAGRHPTKALRPDYQNSLEIDDLTPD
jgi:ectoine hydroxylase-related dioxygenase (phytanoyl-CoA dioxygenase family)